MDFVIRRIDKEYAKYLVFGVSAESPLFSLKEVIDSIEAHDDDVVIFDQLLQTGNKENRFMAINIKEHNFDLRTIRHIDNANIDNSVKGEVAHFLRENEIILRHSILLTEQKKTIINGGIV